MRYLTHAIDLARLVLWLLSEIVQQQAHSRQLRLPNVP